MSWYLHRGGDDQVASSPAAQVGGAQSAEAESRPRLGSRWNLELLGTPFKQRDVDLGAKSGLGDADSELVDQFVTLTMKPLIGPNLDFDVKVSRRSPTTSRLAPDHSGEAGFHRERQLESRSRTFCSLATAPVPAQNRQGSETTVPWPLQVVHGTTDIIVPSNPRRATRTLPAPPQVGQVMADVPGAVPLAAH